MASQRTVRVVVRAGNNVYTAGPLFAIPDTVTVGQILAATTSLSEFSFVACNGKAGASASTVIGTLPVSVSH